MAAGIESLQTAPGLTSKFFLFIVKNMAGKSEYRWIQQLDPMGLPQGRGDRENPADLHLRCTDRNPKRRFQGR
jgi:hypothetical protein